MRYYFIYSFIALWSSFCDKIKRKIGKWLFSAVFPLFFNFDIHLFSFSVLFDIYSRILGEQRIRANSQQNSKRVDKGGGCRGAPQMDSQKLIFFCSQETLNFPFSTLLTLNVCCCCFNLLNVKKIVYAHYCAQGSILPTDLTLSLLS